MSSTYKSSISSLLAVVVVATCVTTTTTTTTTTTDYPMNCSTTSTMFCDEVDMHDYIRPLNYNLTEIVREITHGQGFYILRRGFGQKDIELARAVTDFLTKNKRVDTNTDTSTSAKHNSYGGKSGGIIWRLLGKGKIYEKIAQHPVTLEITRALLGPKSQISSYMSNTVLPGMGFQAPHLDYPYYDDFFPKGESDIHRPLLSVSFMVMLSNFTIANGGTAFRPGSQKQPKYPHDQEEFFKHAVQLQGEPGDIGIFGASTQHCAMANNDVTPRVGIVQSMTPVYLKPYHDIKVSEEMLSTASHEMRTLLATDHPYPMKHG